MDCWGPATAKLPATPSASGGLGSASTGSAGRCPAPPPTFASPASADEELKITQKRLNSERRFHVEKLTTAFCNIPFLFLKLNLFFLQTVSSGEKFDS
jgi:hypothetical protein